MVKHKDIEYNLTENNVCMYLFRQGEIKKPDI